MLGNAPIANQFPAGFGGAFFFSVETLATVGYGDMHPQTVYAHWIATLEIFVGMSSIALATGLIFARFSRPHAKIMFARYAVVRPLDGRMTLMVRAANARQNVIAEARARLRIMRKETTAEGYTLRKLYDLTLVRDQHPVFKLGWTLMHVIDESSPLFGETAETLKGSDTSLLLTLEGVDESTSQTMQARHMWPCDQIFWQHRFVDIMTRAGRREPHRLLAFRRGRAARRAPARIASARRVAKGAVSRAESRSATTHVTPRIPVRAALADPSQNFIETRARRAHSPAPGNVAKILSHRR